MNTPLIDISPDQWAIVHKILQQHVPQHEVWAFGSRAQWTAKEYSDLDLVVITDKPLPLDVVASLKEDFSESDLPWKVDILDWATTSESFRKIIERDKVVVRESKRGLGMSSEWSRVTVEEITSKVAMGPFGSNIKVSTFVPSGVPIISGEHLRGTKVQDGRFNFITEEHAEKLKNSLVLRGDVIFTHAGNIGQVAVIPETSRYERYIISQRQFFGRCKRELVLPEYLTYFFHSPEGKHKLLSNASQVGVPSIARPSSHLKSIEVPLPSIDCQHAICDVLSVLENRIDHNRTLATNLEAIARRLFKSWFVNFDPVRAKAAGDKPPGLADDIAALFPDRLVDSELGEVPEGWSYKPITKIASVLSGGTPKRSVAEYWDGDIPWYSVVDSPQKGDLFVVQTSDYITEEGLKKSAAKLLPPGTTILSARGTVGKLALTCGPMTINQSCYALKGALGDYFTHFTISNSIEWLKQNVHGAVFDTITKSTLDEMIVVAPPEDIAQAFEKVINPLMTKIESSVRERIILSSIRNILLPRLISGKIRVSDAQAQIEEALT
ncbi:MAG: restriction endonuclease subunit S [Ferrovum sp.]|nr:restriction endonuclease subunit S [Ferrovum sp.]